jgi:dUTP pyrophosphatase
MNTIEFKKLKKHAIIPTKAHASDSGFDIYASEEVFVPRGGSALVPTDIAIGLPPGYEAHVRPRSGITSKTPLRVQFGTVDNSYRGHLKVMVDNVEQEPRKNFVEWLFGNKSRVPEGYTIEAGTKIAQLVIAPLPEFTGVEVTSLSEGERGDKGFGSTGGF